MSKFVLDSWAWVEYFEGSFKGERVKEVIFDPRNQVFTHCVSVAEIMSKAQRNGKDTEAILAAITSVSNVVEATLEDSRDVGITHAITKTKHKNFSLADAFVLATARKLNAKVLTGDEDFRSINEAILLR